MKKLLYGILVMTLLVVGSQTTATKVEAADNTVALTQLLLQLQALVTQLQAQLPLPQVHGTSTVAVTSSIPAGTAVTTSAITQYGITWYFASPVTAGVFGNGDFWVRGPVTVTKITPDFDGALHGWEVNPVQGTGAQGFDSRASGYVPRRGW